jgi:hypothetical protein
MIGLSIILILFIRFKFHIDRLALGDILGLTVLCILDPFLDNLYYLIDAFIKNNTWAFLLLVFFTGIYAVSK